MGAGASKPLARGWRTDNRIGEFRWKIRLNGWNIIRKVYCEYSNGCLSRLKRFGHGIHRLVAQTSLKRKILSFDIEIRWRPMYHCPEVVSHAFSHRSESLTGLFLRKINVLGLFIAEIRGTNAPPRNKIQSGDVVRVEFLRRNALVWL